MMFLLSASVMAMSVVPTHPAPYRTKVPATFESQGADRQSIQKLLDNYTKAVSTKDRALFESLLLDKAIPFTGVPAAGMHGAHLIRTANYEAFRQGVFEGEPFTQYFRDIHIRQDGALAQVSLVFVNTTATEKSWGWKTIELVKADGEWKIAAEFFTGHN